MERIFIKPARPGLIVRHPEKLDHIINENGEWVVRTTQWDRYIRCKDVVVCDETDEKKDSEKTTTLKGAK